jgi:hypothetical protein
MQAIRARLHDLTAHGPRAGLRDIHEVIRLLNPVLRGWGCFFFTDHASSKFNAVDSFVRERPLRFRPSAKKKPAHEASFKRSPGGNPALIISAQPARLL